MTAMDQRNTALALVSGGGDANALIGALEDVEETVVFGLSLPPDQLATLASCASHVDSGVRFAWARVVLQRGLRGRAAAPLLDRMWAWSEDVPESARDRRRDAWVALAQALPGSGQQTPLMNALIKGWRRAADEAAAAEMLDLVEGLASIAALPSDASAPLSEAVEGDRSAGYRRRCLVLWCRLALSADAEDPAPAAQAAAWLETGRVTSPGARRRVEQVIIQRGNREQIEVLVAPGDPLLDEHVATCLANRMADPAAPPWMTRLLAAMSERHRGGGPCYEAMLALRRGAMAGANLAEVLPILRRCWGRLSYDRGPWDQVMDNDLKSDLARSSARRDALWLLAAAAEQLGDPLDGLAAEVDHALASLAQEDLSKELGTLDRSVGEGAAARARAKMGLS